MPQACSAAAYTEPKMIPVGYMAKHVSSRPDWLAAGDIADIYSVSGCISEDFDDYIQYWKHNGYWLFDSPEIIRSVAQDNSIELKGTSLFYYEAYEMEFDGECWRPYAPEPSLPTSIFPPPQRQLEGFDVVTFFARNLPECSPLSCNSLANGLPTNAHCLFSSFDEAETHVTSGTFNDSEPGPYRIFAVYSVDWPKAFLSRNRQCTHYPESEPSCRESRADETQKPAQYTSLPFHIPLCIGATLRG